MSAFAMIDVANLVNAVKGSGDPVYQAMSNAFEAAVEEGLEEAGVELCQGEWANDFSIYLSGVLDSTIGKAPDRGPNQEPSAESKAYAEKATEIFSRFVWNDAKFMVDVVNIQMSPDKFADVLNGMVSDVVKAISSTSTKVMFLEPPQIFFKAEAFILRAVPFAMVLRMDVVERLLKEKTGGTPDLKLVKDKG